MVNQLPQGWKEVPFNSIFDVCNSGKEKIKQSEYLPKADGLLPVVDQGQNLVSGYSNQFQKVILAKDNPLIVFGDHTRCVKYIDFDFVVGADGTQLIRTKENTLVKLGYYQLMSANIPNNGYSRHFKYVKEQAYKLIIDKDEQKYIVDTLDAVAEIIRLRKENIQLTKDLIPTIFLEMFGDPITNPKGWKVDRLGNQAKIVGGGTPKTSEPSFWNGDVPWITPKDLSVLNSLTIRNGERFITVEGLKNSSAEMLPAETVLFTSRAPIGYLAIAQNPLCTNQGFKSFICGSNLVPLYLLFYLDQIMDVVKGMASGATFKEISASTAKQISILCPPLSMQEEFADKVEQINKYIAAQQEELEQIETLFQSLLHEAFTGVLTWNYPRKECHDKKDK